MSAPGTGPPRDIASAMARAAVRSVLPLDVQWHASVPSTMDLLSAAAERGAPEGSVVVADEQTAGRGRRGHSWSSPPRAGAYLSYLFRPPDRMHGRLLSLLTLATGVAVRAAVTRASGVVADLKWPNDLLCGRRKLAGILAEGSGAGTAASSIVLGVGVNLLRTAHPPDVERLATSIEGECGQPADRARLFEELLVAVPQAYVTLREGGADDILRQWRAAAPSAIDASVEWDGAAGVVHGITAGIDEDGALLIRTQTGIERVISGEVRWL